MNYRRIWIGCLAAYNAGHLHGEWVDSEGCTTFAEVAELAAPILALSPVANSEEPFIADHEGYEGLIDGEPSFHEVAKAEELIDAFESERGGFADDDDLEALAAFIDNHHGSVDESMDVHETIEQFGDAFCGVYDSESHYGEEMANELIECNEPVPDIIARYFDYDSFTQDLFISDAWAHELSTGDVAVFHKI